MLILIEWKSNNIYERIKKVMNKVIVDTEYSKWKKLKKLQKNDENNLNLYDLFDSYLTKKRIGDIQNGEIQIENDNNYNNLHFCSRCKKKQRYTQKIDLCTFPKYLIIHLQRNINDKNALKYVECPLNTLNLTKYKIRNKLYKNNLGNDSMNNIDEIIMDNCADQKQNDILIQLSYDDEQTIQPIYDLYAVVNNNKPANCYIKSKINNSSSFSSLPSIKSISNYQWYNFNNQEKITAIDKSQIISKNTYLLFYKKR
eukprot:63128_1